MTFEMTKDSRQPTITAHYNVLHKLDKLIEPKLVFVSGARQSKKRTFTRQRINQANYINALAVSVLSFFEPAMPMTLGGLFVTLGGFWYDIG
jgi:hypothetical protein